MSTADTKVLIEEAVASIQKEVPALQKLKLVVELELRGRGDIQLFRVEVPGPKVTRDIAYGPGPLDTLDLMTSGEGQGKPVLIYVHGGGYMGGDKAPIENGKRVPSVGMMAAAQKMLTSAISKKKTQPSRIN